MSKDTNIWVLTHNRNLLPIYNEDCYTPLQVGVDVNGIVNEDYEKDNTGDNISIKNHFTCEISGHYWVWKNRNNSKYVGFEHYRRHFDIKKDEIEEILKENEIILPKPLKFTNSTVQTHYNQCHIKDDFDLCEEIIKDIHPEYLESWDKHIKEGKQLYYANSFITTKENFNSICEFIFSVIFEFEKRRGFNNINDVNEHVKKYLGSEWHPNYVRTDCTFVEYQSRIGGALSERLLTLYVMHNFNKIHHVDLKDLTIEYNRKTVNTLLCCIGRLENDYIREYVEYYKNLGITNICLFDNNYDGEEDFRDVIGDYIDDGFVFLKDYRNRKVCQLNAYNECYETYNKEYDWIMFFDIDEFLVLNKHNHISDFLTHMSFNNYDMIHVNWLIYGDSGIVRKEENSVLNRFTEYLDFEHKTNYKWPDTFHIKSIVRGGLEGIKWEFSPHTPNGVKRCCNPSAIKCDGDVPFFPYDYRNAYIKHFTTKTAEEYANKVKRGFPDGNSVTKEELVKKFFERNEITQEKIDIFKEELGIDMNFLLKKEAEKNKNTQIFSLCYSKKDYEFLNDSVITPLQVGAANGTDVCELKDNTLDNISGVNYFYIENTGIYWIWKNVVNAKYKGQMQYRRPLSGVNENMDFEEIFSKYDVITCEPFHHPSHKEPTEETNLIISADTVEQGYAFSNCIDDLYIMEMVVKSRFPEYSESWDKYIKNGPNLYYSNGFIMKSEDYDKYCEFLFECLKVYTEMSGIENENDLFEHVRYNIEVGKYQRYESLRDVTNEAIKWQCAIGGFLSERLWTLWLQHHFSDERIYKLPYIKMEKNMYT